jgi:hypothetical protein
MAPVTVKTLTLKQPNTKKPVIELTVGGWVGNKFRSANGGWAGFTLPLPWVVLIFYWLIPGETEPNPYVRVHEMVHVIQDARHRCFLGTWYAYLREMWSHSYRDNIYEVEAYTVQYRYETANALPDWAHTA